MGIVGIETWSAPLGAGKTPIRPNRKNHDRLHPMSARNAKMRLRLRDAE